MTLATSPSRSEVSRTTDSRRTGTLALIAVTIGVALRLAHFLARPSLQLDEARLALDVATRSWTGLLRPLDYDQTAPPIFLWLEKAAILFGGVNDLAFRLPAIVPGILCLPLLYVVARRVAAERAALIATAIAAVSPLFIQYSVESKPYAVDVLVALVLVYLALDWAEAARSARAAGRMMAAGAVAVWGSTPSIFVLAGIAAALWLGPSATRPPRAWLAAVTIAWATSFAIVYLLFYHPVAANPYMQQYWAESLVTLWRPHALWRAWQGARDVAWQVFFGGTTEPPKSADEDATVALGAAAIILLAGAGLWHLAARDRRRALFLLGPLVAVLTASTLGLYPIAARVMLFVAPTLIILVAAAPGAMASRPAASPALRAAASFAGLVLLLPPLKRDLLLAWHPTAFEHVRPAVAEFRRRALPGEPIYVFTGTLPAWTFYTTDWSAPDLQRLERVARLGSSGGPAFENAPPRGHSVGTENDSLVFALDGTREILGAAHGAQWRSGIGLVQYQPDPGWAAAEARRIRAAANPGAWLLVSHSYRLELFIYPELERLGGRLEYAYGEDGVVLRRYSFP
jgi:4-amino-4-deoxy-L-arabinose transferase-like glycosyltransferase